MRSDYAPVNGLKLYYEIHGESNNTKPPLVLLHGGGSTIDTSFGAILPRLAANRRVIAFDQQGHGRTGDIADRPFSFKQSAEDTVALLRHLKIDRADLFGFSNGGMITLQIGISHPNVVRKLIVESAMYSRHACPPEFWSWFQNARLEMMPQELRDTYRSVAPQPENLQSFFDKGVERMRNFQGWSPAQIQSIQAPTLVLMGDRDVASPEHGVSMYRLIPYSQLCILPGTDHGTIVSSPLVPPIVDTFLES